MSGDDLNAASDATKGQTKSKIRSDYLGRGSKMQSETTMLYREGR